MLAYFFAFLGGIALFFYGMQLMSDGLQKAAGEKLQGILEKMTGVLIFGVMLGALVTAVLQSSSATTVMTIGLVNAGLLTLKQAFGIVMGANIGTTMMAQLIAFKLTDYVTLMLFIGVMVQMLAKRVKYQYIGQVILGFGVIMMGMEMMSGAVIPLKEYQGFRDFIATFGANPILGVVVGTVITLLVQSSGAIIAILIAMAMQGLIGLDGAIPVLLGTNIGTCITAVLAALNSNPTAKRVALAHVLFNVIGSVIFLFALKPYEGIILAVSPADYIARQIANAHTLFNLINTIIFMPFTNQFIALIERIMPSKGEIISMRPEYLDKSMLATPTVAMSLAVKETVRMGELARTNVGIALESLRGFDKDKLTYVLEHEPVVDSLETNITDYLTEMSEHSLPEYLSYRHTSLLHAVNDIERIGDHAQTLAKKSRMLFEEGIVFSEEAQGELAKLSEMVMDASGRSLEALEKNSKELAGEAVELCRAVKRFQKEIRKNHITRLGERKCDPVAGFVMLELLINMKRIADHSKNIAQLVQGTF